VEGRGDCRVGERLTREREFRATLREKALTVANLLDRVLIFSLRDFKVRRRRVVLGARDDALLDERGGALQIVALLIEHGARLPDRPRLFKLNLIVIALRRESESRARLLQRGVGLLDAELVVLLLDLCDRPPTMY